MTKRVAIINGHPDASEERFGRALVDAYAVGAREGGHEVRIIELAQMDFPLLRTKEEFEHGVPPQAIQQAQQTIAWAGHLVICYPLWLGTMPALLKAFFEQAFRPGFAIAPGASGKLWKKLLKGRSARVVVTMGMPAFFYRWYYGAHGLKSLEKNVLAFSGIKPIRETLIGTVDALEVVKRENWLTRLEQYGRDAS